MAQFFEDFAGYSVSDWATQSGGEWIHTAAGGWLDTIVSGVTGSTGDRCATFDNDSNPDAFQAVRFTPPDWGVSDVEVVARRQAPLVTTFGLTANGPVLIRSNSPTYIGVNYVSGTNWRMVRYDSAGVIVTYGAEEDTGFTPTANVWFWIRLTWGTAGETRFKVWADGDAEPVAWSAVFTITATSVAPAIVAFDSTRIPIVDRFGVGTSTDSAPTSGGGPTVTLATPATAVQGATLSVTITGTGFETEVV